MTTQAVADVIAERERQVTVERNFPAQDDAYTALELARAAWCYLLHYVMWFRVFDQDPAKYQGQEVVVQWPWHYRRWKPKNPRRDLVRAAALVIAEIERLDRAAKQPINKVSTP